MQTHWDIFKYTPAFSLFWTNCRAAGGSDQRTQKFNLCFWGWELKWAKFKFSENWRFRLYFRCSLPCTFILWTCGVSKWPLVIFEMIAKSRYSRELDVRVNEDHSSSQLLILNLLEFFCHNIRARALRKINKLSVLTKKSIRMVVTFHN